VPRSVALSKMYHSSHPALGSSSTVLILGLYAIFPRLCQPAAVSCSVGNKMAAINGHGDVIREHDLRAKLQQVKILIRD
jgi:hypothetical protein